MSSFLTIILAPGQDGAGETDAGAACRVWMECEERSSRREQSGIGSQAWGKRGSGSGSGSVMGWDERGSHQAEPAQV